MTDHVGMAMERVGTGASDYVLDLESGVIREVDPDHASCVGTHLCNRCRAEVRGEVFAWLHALAVAHDSPLEVRPWDEHILVRPWEEHILDS
jgi:hypothetical protein